MSEQPNRPNSDMRFMLASMAFMVVIIALLAGLWLAMRARAIRAESQLAQLKALTGGWKQDATTLDKLLKAKPIMAPALDREALATETVRLNGQAVTAYKVSVAEGLHVGLAPGDVLLVEALTHSTTTAPASAPTP